MGGFLPLGFLRFLLIEPLSGQGDARVRFLLPSPVWTDECLMIDVFLTDLCSGPFQKVKIFICEPIVHTFTSLS